MQENLLKLILKDNIFVTPEQLRNIKVVMPGGTYDLIDYLACEILYMLNKK